jgi:hypothetical protein
MAIIAGVSNVHIDAALTNMSIELPIEQGLIQDMVCPSHKVSKESDKYFIFDRVGAKEYDVARALGAEANQFKIGLSSDSYSCEEYAISSAIPFRMIANQDEQIDLEASSTEEATRILRMARERRVAALVQTTSNWADTTGVSAAWNGSSADINKDMDAATQAFHLQAGILPNLAVISFPIYRAIIAYLRSDPTYRSNADYRGVEFTLDKSGVASQLSGLFGIQTWLVGMQIKDTAIVGKDHVGAYMWANTVTLLYVNPSAGRKDRTALKTFVSEDLTIKKFVSDPKDSLFIQASHVLQEKVVAKSLGYTITGAIT